MRLPSGHLTNYEAAKMQADSGFLTIWSELDDRRRRAFAQIEKLRSQPATAERGAMIAQYECIIADAARQMRRAERLLGLDRARRGSVQ